MVMVMVHTWYLMVSLMSTCTMVRPGKAYV
jgi:hypothetical protein